MISEAAIGGGSGVSAYPFPQLAVYTVEEHGVKFYCGANQIVLFRSDNKRPNQNVLLSFR